jgi:hypothetical protein
MPRAQCVGDIFTPQDPVDGEILKDLPLVDVLTQATLIGHVQLLHHTPRSRIASQVGGMNTVQPKHLKPILDHRLGRLRAVAVIPVGLPNPIAELCVAIVRIDPEAHGSQEHVVGAPHKSEVDERTLRELLLVGTDPSR